jgi:hypothetical protein
LWITLGHCLGQPPSKPSWLSNVSTVITSCLSLYTTTVFTRCVFRFPLQEGARNGPSLMPGGPREAYTLMEPIITKIAAQVDDGPCVTYIGELGSGNYVKMVHNGIEYGDMQLIAEAYDVLRTVWHFFLH